MPRLTSQRKEDMGVSRQEAVGGSGQKEHRVSMGPSRNHLKLVVAGEGAGLDLRRALKAK